MQRPPSINLAEASFTPSRSRRGIVIFSGGSAANHLVNVFASASEARMCHLTYVIPISDNGGSTSEVVRVLGGPGIGDIRSRLVRLIPDDGHPESHAIRTFFSHRLPSDPSAARLEWLDIVEDISSPKKELIRSYLNFVNAEIVKRARPSSVFAFEDASIGNLFLTGARLFTGSFEAAIYLLSSICTIPANVSVLPAINTNFSHHICAGLANGDIIAGQNAISHPSEPTVLQPHPTTHHGAMSPRSLPVDLETDPTRMETETADHIEDANLPGSLPTLRRQYIKFSKVESEDDELPARIERLWYINVYGQEIRPPPNPKIIDAVNYATSIIYCIGSLYTSIVPSLVLRGVGEAIRRSTADQKILFLNGSLDRETGPKASSFSALDFVHAIARAGLESSGTYGRAAELDELSMYCTHIIHLEGEGVPKVDKAAFSRAGVETVRVYGRKGAGGKSWQYDEKALTQTLTALVGQKHVKRDVSRRNTLEK